MTEPIDPDDFPGTDRDKIEAAIITARMRTPRPSVRLSRRYDLGDGPVSCENAAAAARDFGVTIETDCPVRPRMPEGAYGYGVEYGPCDPTPIKAPPVSARVRRAEKLYEARWRLREAWNVLRNGVDTDR